MKSEIKKNLKATHSAKAKVMPQPPPIRDKKNETIFIVVTLFAYLVIGLIGVLHHEMWRDELCTWQRGSTSKTFGDFLHTISCEPLLWYIINFISSRFINLPVMAQLAHLLISTGSVFLILKYAPFSRLQKILLCSSYYILYEYSLVARGYALTVFCLFLFCSFYQIKSKYRYPLLALILVGLANAAGAEGIIFTLGIISMMVVDYYFSEDTSIQKNYKPIQLFIAIAISLFGIYFALKCISPPQASDRGNTWYTSGFDSQRMTIALRTFWMSYLPLENPFILNSWNSNFFFQKDTGNFTFTILFLLSISIFIFCILLYIKKLNVTVFYLSVTCGILLFCYTNNVIYAILGARHYGFMFMAFIASAWLAPNLRKTKISIPLLPSLSNALKIEQKFTYLLTGLLCISTFGAIAYYKDYIHVFSNSKNVGEYIVSHHLQKLPEAGFIYYSAIPIPAYTGQSIYLIDEDYAGVANTADASKLSYDPNILFNRTSNFILSQPDSVLLITTGDYFNIGEVKVINNILFALIASYNGAIVPDENYNIYIARKFDLNKQMQDSGSYRNPTIVSAILSSGYDLLQKGNLDDAEKIFISVEEKTHKMAIPHLHSYFGMLYTKKNMTSSAEKEFHAEITLNLQKEEAFFNLGMLYFQGKDYPNAIKAWDSTISINPKNADALNNLGVSYLNFKGDNNTAKGYFEKALELNPNYTQGYYNILACAQNTNDQDALIKYTRILLDKGASINDIKAKGINITDALLQKINSR